MTEHEKMLEDLKKQKLLEQEEMLSKNSKLIESFILFCKSKNLDLSFDNFEYIRTIGIVASYPNLVTQLNGNIIVDKEELVSFDLLESEFNRKPFISGTFYSNYYIVMAHHYFRRGHNEESNFPPSFIGIFWGFNQENNKKHVAIDLDRVRINVDDSIYLELDTWFGAKFKNSISEIKDGIVKLRPPIDIKPSLINFIFGNTYSLDIKWYTKNNIKVFQAEEFKSEKCKIKKNGIEYFPVKYVHAEFDSNSGTFRHFDGAIHLYTEKEYFLRRDTDYNHNDKNNSHLKTISQKLFKINGQIEIKDWVKLTSHYLAGNPLIFEYFEGKLPDRTIEKVEKLRKHKS